MVLSAVLLLGAPTAARADTSSWFRGSYDVLLGYGCTNFWLEPFDSRFDCPDGYRVHEGVDFDTPVGTPLVAGFKGTVMEVGGRETHDYGPHYVVIYLAEGHDVLLGHLSRADVEPGQQLRVGDPIGLTGDLGECNWPNLHFEVRVHGGTTYQSVDPTPFLVSVAPTAIKNGSMATTNGTFEKLPVGTAEPEPAPVITVVGDAPPWSPVLDAATAIPSPAVIGGALLGGFWILARRRRRPRRWMHA